MTTITKKIDLNVSQPNNYQLVHAMQGDSNTVEILVTIWNGNKLYSIDCDRVSLEWQSPSGGKRDYPIHNYTQHTATFLLKEEMLAENGDYTFCLRFDNSKNHVLRTFCSTMKVMRAPFGQLMDSEVVTLTELVNKAKFYYEQLISESSNLACNLLYLPDIVNANSAGGASWQGGRFFCNIPSEDITVWSWDGLYSFGKIPLPEGGYVYPASSDSADVLVIYTLDGKENQVEVSNGAVLPENAVVTEYRLERKAGASRIIADIYPMISSGKRPVSEFVPYTGDGRKINKCVAELAVPRYEVPDRRLVLSPGESLKIALGKISRWFQDLKEVAFSGSYNDLTDKPNAQSIGALEATTKYASSSTIGGDANRAKKIADNYNGNDVTFAYGKAGLDYGNYTWLAAWNGYELRTVNKNQFAQSNHSHNYALASHAHNYTDLNGRYMLHTATISIPSGMLAFSEFYDSGGSATIGSFMELAVVSMRISSGLLFGWSYSGTTLSIRVLKHGSSATTATVYYFAR